MVNKAHAKAFASQPTAFVGLGANLGDARSSLIAAVRQIEGLPGTRLAAVSSLYRSAPVDSSGPDYLNAVVGLETDLPPRALLHALQRIEQLHGRERPYPNAPRTLDLDLLAYGEVTQQDPELTLPHPRAHLRAFVLQPWAELAPDLILAGRECLAVLAAAVTDQPIELIAPAPHWLVGGANI